MPYFHDQLWGIPQDYRLDEKASVSFLPLVLSVTCSYLVFLQCSTPASVSSPTFVSLTRAHQLLLSWDFRCWNTCWLQPLSPDSSIQGTQPNSGPQSDFLPEHWSHLITLLESLETQVAQVPPCSFRPALCTIDPDPLWEARAKPRLWPGPASVCMCL